MGHHLGSSNYAFNTAFRARALTPPFRRRPLARSPKLRHSEGSAKDEKESSSSSYYDTRRLLELVRERCPSYAVVTSRRRGEMRLIVLAREGLADEIRDFYVAGENTGIGGIMANKVRTPTSERSITTRAWNVRPRGCASRPDSNLRTVFCDRISILDVAPLSRAARRRAASSRRSPCGGPASRS